jgi:hypothetical protein
LLADEVIAGVPVQFRDKFGPIGRKGKLGHSDVGAARRRSGYVDENDRQMLIPENTREAGRPADDFANRVNGGHSDDAFLQVNYDQGSGGIEFR